MPRLDHRLDAVQALRPEDALFVQVLLTEINVLRLALNLPPRTLDDLRPMLQKAARTQAALRQTEGHSSWPN